jgi:hypothetical protein
MSSKTLTIPKSEKEVDDAKENRKIEVRVHIPKSVRNRQEKINRIYDILCARTS